jgi:hypothetical protein
MVVKNNLNKLRLGHIDIDEVLAELEEKHWSSEMYEALIPVAEKECVDKIGLLENYQLQLRGDCIEEERADRVLYHQKFGSVRNVRRTLLTEDDKVNAVGVSLEMICFANNHARVYEKYNQEKGDDKKVPVLMYGFRTFSKRQAPLTNEDFNRYFEGATDDIGADSDEMRSIILPKTTKRTIDGQSVESNTVFPPPSFNEERLLLLPPIAYKRLDRISVPLVGVAEPKAYFNALLMLHKILSDLELYAKDKEAQII